MATHFHEPGRNWAKNGAKVGGHVRALSAVENDPPKSLPHFVSEFITPCLVAEVPNFYLCGLLGLGDPSSCCGISLQLGLWNWKSLALCDCECLEFPKAVVLNAVGCRNAQKSAKERKNSVNKRKAVNKRKTAQTHVCKKNAKGRRKRALPRKNCEQQGLKQPGLQKSKIVCVR